MSICNHCGKIGYHSRWCTARNVPLFLPRPTTRIEITGNIIVHHEVKA